MREEERGWGVEGLLLVLQPLSVIGGPAREIENNTAWDHRDLLSRWPKKPILNTILLSAILSVVIIHSTAVSMCRLRSAETFISSQGKTIWALASLSNPSSASVAFCNWQSVWRVAPKANKCLTLQCSLSQQWLLQATFSYEHFSVIQLFQIAELGENMNSTWISIYFGFCLESQWRLSKGLWQHWPLKGRFGYKTWRLGLYREKLSNKL